MPNHCLSSENVDIYFGLWRASFKCLATAKDTELAGKFQPQCAAWWPINFALICSFLVGVGVLFAGLVRCLVEELGLMITFWSACGTKSLPPRHNKCCFTMGLVDQKVFLQNGEISSLKMQYCQGKRITYCTVDKWEFSHILTKKLIVWNETFYRMLLLPLTTVQNFSGWNPRGFVEDNPGMRCGTWLSWAAVVGPVGDRKPNRTPVFAADTDLSWVGVRLLAVFFFPYKDWATQATGKEEEEEVLKWIESRLGVMAANPFLWSQSMGLTFPDTFFGPANILARFFGDFYMAACETWLHLRL